MVEVLSMRSKYLKLTYLLMAYSSVAMIEFMLATAWEPCVLSLFKPAYNVSAETIATFLASFGISYCVNWRLWLTVINWFKSNTVRLKKSSISCRPLCNEFFWSWIVPTSLYEKRHMSIPTVMPRYTEGYWNWLKISFSNCINYRSVL